MNAAAPATVVIFTGALTATSVAGVQPGNPVQATLRIDPGVHVTKGFENENFKEPHIIALPTDPASLMAVSFLLKAPPGPGLRSECVIFVSSDGGSSWSRAPGGTFAESRICVDPWLAADEDGTVFLAYLHSFEETDSDFRLGVCVRRSVDGGLTWSDPVAFPLDGARGYDKPSIVVDNAAGSPHRGSVYVHAAAGARLASGERIRWIAAGRSGDDAASFATPQRIGEAHLVLNSGNPAVLFDGTLLIPFNDVGTGGAKGLLQYPRIWLARSENGGRSFSLPFLVTEIADAYPYMLATDRSEGIFRGRAYIAFKGRQGGSQIYVTHSEDRGMTWSDPIRVNDNANDEAFHLAPMIAVNRQGSVLVAWYDRRSDPENLCTEIYGSASLDGGATFLPNVRVSMERSCAPDDGRGADMQKWNIGGEYAGITASTDGAFHVVWSDARGGTFQLWSSRIVVDATR